MGSSNLTDLKVVFQSKEASIRDAMLAIQLGSANVAIAVDDAGKLVGVVTDGDIRRALLQGNDLSDPVAPFIMTQPIVASEADSRAAVLDLMQARGILQVPVLNSQGRVVAVHLIRELLGRIDRPNIAVVMAGGRGARLQPMTDSIPKPMLTVAGRPILERILNHLVGFGITDIVLSVGYLASVIEAHFADGKDFGCNITYVREDPTLPLGTGGSLAYVHKIFPDVRDPVLVLNGDLITQFDVSALLDHHIRTLSSVTIGSLTYSHKVPFGVLELSDSGQVQLVVEKPTRIETVSGGIYVFSPEILATVPEGVFMPITQILVECVSRGDIVTTWSLDEDWLDVGRPQDLARARGIDA